MSDTCANTIGPIMDEPNFVFSVAFFRGSSPHNINSEYEAPSLRMAIVRLHEHKYYITTLVVDKDLATIYMRR